MALAMTRPPPSRRPRVHAAYEALSDDLTEVRELMALRQAALRWYAKNDDPAALRELRAACKAIKLRESRPDGES